MKKLFIMAVSSLMIFLLAGCGSSDAANSPSSQQKMASTVTDKNDSANAKTSEDKSMNTNGKKILVTYFSQTGNTRRAAEQIHNLVGGDIVEIKTVTPYPTGYNECVEVAKQEKETNARPVLSTKIDNMDSYDVIFVGYPIWWHTAPMAIYTFLQSYNFSGKTVIPFCTSASSEFSESMPAIQSLCPNSTILEGVRANEPKEVEAWLAKIGMR
ncbi:flavodoxin [Pectinatus haikarae]|uniref:flavodoxin n=1 Tax=Pectinatus haikarae TaxID=349096 RepID=UPI0018C6739A|nr:flavodoxin [Pectinatus haikarae]